MDSHQRVEEMVRRLTGGVRYVQADLQDYPHPHPELAERIAEAICAQAGVYGVGLGLDAPTARLLADAALAALGLRQESQRAHSGAVRRRYVTDWVEDV